MYLAFEYNYNDRHNRYVHFQSNGGPNEGGICLYSDYGEYLGTFYSVNDLKRFFNQMKLTS